MIKSTLESKQIKMKTSNKVLNSIFALSTLALLASGSSVAQADDVKELEARLNKINSRLEEIEIQSALNKMTFSGVLVNRYEAYHTTYGVPGAAKSTDHVNAFTTFFALNIDAKVTSKINFYSTIAMSKFWNNDGRNEAPGYWSGSLTGSYGLKGSTPMIDRAYMTYSFDVPLTFAIGRMPTSNGLPINQLDGLGRQGTYPRLAYNAIFDGLALVYNFSSYLPTGHSLSMRAFYTPFTNVSATDRTRQHTDSGLKVPSNTSMGILLTEYNNSNISFLGNLNLTHMIYDYRNFYWDGFNNPNDHTNTSPHNPYYDGGANMLYAGLEDIAHVGLNASISGLFYWSKWTKTAQVPDTTGTQSKKRSSAYLVNVNQKLKNDLVIGGEYMKSDENYYLDEWAYQNTMAFYKTPNSKGYHLFVADKLAKSLTGRIGFYSLKSLPCGANSTNPTLTSESKATSVYANLRLDF